MTRLIGFVLLFIAFSCGHSKKMNETSEIDNLLEGGRVEVFRSNSHFPSDTSSVRIDFVIASPSSPLKPLTDSLIALYLDLDCCKDGREQLTIKTFTDYSNSFLDGYTDLIHEDSSASFPWWLNVTIDLFTIDNAYLKADFSMEAYTGGAHGNVNVSTYMIDVEEKEIVKLEDICSNIEELEKRAEVIFRREYEIAPDANLGEEGFWFQDNQFHLNRNFSFENETLVFVFNQYEIAPYSMGLFYIEIPFSTIKDILTIKKK